MGALKGPGRTVHHRLIQPLWVKVGPVDVEGVADAGVEDAVGILLFQAGADGVELLRHVKGPADHNVLRQAGVHRQRDAVGGDGGGGAEVGDVVLGVDPGVGAAAARNLYRVAADRG